MHKGRQNMKNIVLLKGDGIGPEIAAQAVKVLSLLKGFALQEEDFGGCAIDKTGSPCQMVLFKRRSARTRYCWRL